MSPAETSPPRRRRKASERRKATGTRLAWAEAGRDWNLDF